MKELYTSDTKLDLRIFKGICMADALEHFRSTISILGRSLSDLKDIMPDDTLPDFRLTPVLPPSHDDMVNHLEIQRHDNDIWKFITQLVSTSITVRAGFNNWREAPLTTRAAYATAFQNLIDGTHGESTFQYVTRHSDPHTDHWTAYSDGLYSLKTSSTLRLLEVAERQYKDQYEHWKLNHARHLKLVTEHSKWRAGFLSTLNESEQHALRDFPTLREIKRQFLLRHEGINGIESSRAQWEKDWLLCKEHPIPDSKIINLTARHGICYGYEPAALESLKGKVANLFREIIPQTRNFVLLNNLVNTQPIVQSTQQLLDIYRSSCLEDRQIARTKRVVDKINVVTGQEKKVKWDGKKNTTFKSGKKPDDICHFHAHIFKDPNRTHTNKDCISQKYSAKKKAPDGKLQAITCTTSKNLNETSADGPCEASITAKSTTKNYLCMVKTKQEDAMELDRSVQFDSGASCHAQGDLTGLYDVQDCFFPIIVANGENMVCTQKGKRQLTVGPIRLGLREVYVCSGVDGLLVSVKQLIRNSNDGILFTTNKVFWVDGTTQEKSVIGHNIGNAYYAVGSSQMFDDTSLMNFHDMNDFTLHLGNLDSSLHKEYSRLLRDTKSELIYSTRTSPRLKTTEYSVTALDAGIGSTQLLNSDLSTTRLTHWPNGTASDSTSTSNDSTGTAPNSPQSDNATCKCAYIEARYDESARQKILGNHSFCNSNLPTLMPITDTTSHPSDDSVPLDIFQLHCQLGHQSLPLVKDALRKGKVVINSNKIKRLLKNIPASFYCLFCDSARLVRFPVRTTQHSATKILERVHSDIWKLPVKSPEGFKYIAFLVDEFTRHGFTILCRTKHDWVSGLETLFAQLNNKDPALKIKSIRSDGGELATSESMKTLCATMGISLEVSPAYDKEFNGLVESFIKEVTRKAASLLAQSRLPPMFSMDALIYAVYVKNLTVHTTTKETPHYLWYNTRPTLDGLLPFGCQVLIYSKGRPGRRDPVRKNHALSLVGDRGLFLGHIGSTLYRVWNINLRTYQSVYHMKPYVTLFPGLTLHHQGDQLPDADSVGQSSDDESLVVELEDESDTDDSQDSEVDSSQGSTYRLNLPAKRSISQIDPQDTIVSQTFDLPCNMSISNMFDTIDHDSEPESDPVNTALSISEIEHPSFMGDQVSGSSVPWIQIDLPERRNFQDFVKRLATNLNHQSSLQLRTFINDGYMKPFVFQISDSSTKNIPFPNASAIPKNVITQSSLPPAPKTRSEAKKSPHWNYWKQAEQVELNKMSQMNTSEVVLRPSGRKVLYSKWVYTYKINNTTKTLDEFKARLVACGYSQIAGIDYDDVFAPVVKIQSVRILTALAVLLSLKVRQADIQTAFLHGKLSREIYMKMPPGYELMDQSTGHQKVWLLKGTIYGLKQSPREWYAVLSDTLKSIGFTPLVSDSCVFILRQQSKLPILLMVYVDDLLLMCTDEDILDKLVLLIKDNFKTRDMGEVDKIIGMEHVRFDNSMYVGQPSYTKMILEQSNHWTKHTGDTERPVDIKLSPMTEGWEHDDTSSLLNDEDKTVYVHQLMQLVYLASHSRPDISYATNTLSAYLQKPTNSASAALSRIMRYLRATWDFGLHYIKSNTTPVLFVNDPRDIEKPTLTQLGLEVVGYADANYGPKPDRKSRTGWCFMLGGAVTTWSSKKQPVISLSSTEAEYYALGDGVKEALWLRELMQEIGFTLDKPTTIHQDNQSTMAIALNPIHHSHVKHMSIRSHFIRDHIAKEEVKLVYCPTGDMIADIFTKALPVKQHQRLTSLMGLRSLADIRGISSLNFYSEDLRF